MCDCLDTKTPAPEQSSMFMPSQGACGAIGVGANPLFLVFLPALYLQGARLHPSLLLLIVAIALELGRMVCLISLTFHHCGRNFLKQLFSRACNSSAPFAMPFSVHATGHEQGCKSGVLGANRRGREASRRGRLQVLRQSLLPASSQSLRDGVVPAEHCPEGAALAAVSFQPRSTSTPL